MRKRTKETLEALNYLWADYLLDAEGDPEMETQYSNELSAIIEAENGNFKKDLIPVLSSVSQWDEYNNRQWARAINSDLAEAGLLEKWTPCDYGRNPKFTHGGQVWEPRF
jgi:hypothetical protein